MLEIILALNILNILFVLLLYSKVSFNDKLISILISILKKGNRVPRQIIRNNKSKNERKFVEKEQNNINEEKLSELVSGRSETKVKFGEEID